ncbi:putative alcohol dehydrogenase [Nemania sp. FL0916]|nr:putative alcohol dehydrogenase [Nemania sp. FL0916]
MDMSAEIPRAQSVLAQAPEQSHGGPVAPILSHNAPIPPLPSPNHVLVRVLAVALNPTDYKMPAHFPMPDSTMGCDFCGIVPAEASAPLPPLGTRVCGAVYAYNPEDPLTGAFAQYVVADARLLLRVPADWSDLRAAALGGIGWGTAGLALWGSDALSLEGRPTRPLDANNANKTPVLVYGGATATGTMACQLLKLSGYVPIAVTSKTSAPLATSFGAATTVAYTSPTCTAAIKDFIATGNKPSQQLQPLRHALDCITDPESAAVCFGALGRTGGRYACLEAFDEAWRSRRAVRVEVIMAYELWGARVILDDGNSPAAIYSRPANPGKLRATIAWASEMQNLLDNGLIENHPVCELDGKWDGIMKGLGMLRHGKVRGCKLVVRISEA